MKYGVCGLVIGIAALLAVTPVSAHHAVAAKFNRDKPVTLKGLVTEVDWLNPHVHVFINVENASRVTNWAIELESPIDLQKSGWNRETLKPGDAITVQGISARDGSAQAWGNSVTVDSTNKRVFTLASAPPPRRDNQPTPRWPDGKPRLGAPPRERGYWGNPSATTLVQTGANVQMDADGLLRNIADVDKVAPFQRWARDLYEYRQRSFLKDDPQYLFCKPPGGPRQFQQPYGIQFVEDKDHQRIFVFIGGGDHNWRVIYTDGRPQDGPPEDPRKPIYYGRAVAKWEGDTLVVDSKRFNEEFWITNGGLPHTEQLHLIERFSRPDLNTLKYEVTIDDPGAYTKMWSGGWTLQWNPGEELPQYWCQDNRP